MNERANVNVAVREVLSVLWHGRDSANESDYAAACDALEDAGDNIEQALRWLDGTNPGREANLESVRRILRATLTRIGEGR